jgi:hypothetical protein
VNNLIRKARKSETNEFKELAVFNQAYPINLLGRCVYVSKREQVWSWEFFSGRKSVGAAAS